MFDKFKLHVNFLLHACYSLNLMPLISYIMFQQQNQNILVVQPGTIYAVLPEIDGSRLSYRVAKMNVSH